MYYMNREDARKLGMALIDAADIVEASEQPDTASGPLAVVEKMNGEPFAVESGPSDDTLVAVF